MKKLAVILPVLLALAAPTLAHAEAGNGRGRNAEAFAGRDRDDDGPRGSGRGGQRAGRGDGQRNRGDDNPGQRDRGGDARQQVREGRRVALRDVIPNIARRTPGRMLDSFAENGPGGRAQYRVRWQSDSGERIDYIVDAETGAIIRRE
ncbi:MAG: hypothetical protein K1X35_11580 [Caulobacteraceae bacterium]|nr:hypothetical protein [Caulobacteraceae bacterium]